MQFKCNSKPEDSPLCLSSIPSSLQMILYIIWSNVIISLKQSTTKCNFQLHLDASDIITRSKLI